MFSKDLRVGLLLDFYGDVLSDHTRSVMEQYYASDLSLAEIADAEGISRQGIRHVIKKGEEQLFFLEEKLGLAAEYERIRQTAAHLLALSESLTGDPDARLSAIGEEIRKAARDILSAD